MASDPVKKFSVTEVSGPDYRSTAPVNKPTHVEIMLGEMRAEMRDRFEQITNIVLDMGQDVASLKAARKADEERANRHSDGIQTGSKTDMRHEAALAMLMTKADRTDAKVDALTTNLAANNAMTARVADKIVDGTKSFFKEHPKLETALVGFLMAALTLGTALLYSLAKGHQ